MHREMNPRFAWWPTLLFSHALVLTHPFLQAAENASERPFIFEAEQMIPMRDGTRLAANLFRPKGDGRFPVILMRSPYGKGDANFGDAKRYTAAGYAMVVQDCRGRGKSEGVWDPFRYDAEDGFDTQEWVGQQPWCNGELGTAGGSYLGWTQWASSAGGSRFLKCMVPVVPFAEVYEDIAYPGGAFQLALLMGWGTGVGGLTLSPEKLQQAFRHLPLRTFTDQFDKKVPYLNDWVAHDAYDDYWKKRGIGHRFAEVKVPALNIGGWYDIFSKTTIDLVDRVRASSRDRLARRNQLVIMGPWAHGVGVQKVGELDFGQEAKLDIGAAQFKWFEYWLKDKETGVEDWPALRLFIMGENKWRDEHEWPLKRTEFTRFYLRSASGSGTVKGGMLDRQPPGDEKSDSYVSDPNDPVPTHGGNNLVGAKAGPYDQSALEQRLDVLTFSTGPLEKELEATGPVKVMLWAATTANDTDFTAKLIDVHPDGKAYNLCDGIIRARYRAGREPQAVTPGEPLLYEIDLWVTANLFRTGHQVRVEIASSNFPRFDRNPNSGKPFGTDTELLKATQTVYHDANHASHLVLPIIPR